MDSPSEIEKRFVNNFIRKGRRERSLWALSKAGKKRTEFLNRFHNQWPDLIDQKKCELWDITDSNNVLDRISSQLKLKESDVMYTISYYNTDGQIMHLRNALDKSQSKGCACLLISSDGSKFYFKAEQEVGTPKKYLGMV